MGWLFRVLSWVGILYEVIRCVMCLAELVIKKGRHPQGWVLRQRRGPDGEVADRQWTCPRCAP